jgi:hypothetical protein
MYTSGPWASSPLHFMSGSMEPRCTIKNIWVFRTSVISHEDVTILSPLLDSLMHAGDKWNFDLEDCDHILRVETHEVQPFVIIEKLALAGYACAELGDHIPGESFMLYANLDCSEAIPAASRCSA